MWAIMPRKGQAQMAKLPTFRQIARDEAVEKHRLAAERKIVELAARDAEEIWDMLKAGALFGGISQPQAMLLREMLRTIAPEQRHHDQSRGAMDPAVLAALASRPFSLTVQVAAGAEPLQRGTLGARQEAIELEEKARGRYEAEGLGGSGSRPADLQRPQLPDRVAQ